MMAVAHLNTVTISDWQSFHEESRRAFGFPAWYGMNMNAWIDCLTYLGEEEMLEIEVSDSTSFMSRLPEIYHALVECSSFVNKRNVEAGKRPMLSLTLL